MSWPAKYDGWCPACEERIEVLDRVKWADGQVVHADCTVASTGPDGPVETCPTCHLVPAANGACGCD